MLKTLQWLLIALGKETASPDSVKCCALACLPSLLTPHPQALSQRLLHCAYPSRHTSRTTGSSISWVLTALFTLFFSH